MPVGVAREVEDEPAADCLTRLEPLGLVRVVDERPQLLLVLEDRARLVFRHPVLEQVVEGALGRLARPGALADLVVERSLVHGSAGQARHDRGTAHMIGMEVRDDDPVGHSRLREYARPLLLGAGQPEAGVDEHRRAVVRGDEIRVHVVDPERERERDANDPAV